MFSNESGTKSQLNNCVFLKECVYCKLFNCLSSIELINSAYLWFVLLHDVLRMRANEGCGHRPLVVALEKGSRLQGGMTYCTLTQFKCWLSWAVTKDCTVSLRTPNGITDNAFCSTLLVLIWIRLLSYLRVLKWPHMEKKNNIPKPLYQRGSGWVTLLCMDTI